jgi:hypothetical protein
VFNTHKLRIVRKRRSIGERERKREREGGREREREMGK